jgi:hypothetical protein
LDAGLAALRAFQAARLERTYADLLVDPEYAPACRFFLSDVYAARDFTSRDQDLERFYELLARLLPAEMLRLVADTVLLNRMTADLDLSLRQQLDALVGPQGEITWESYGEGYRRCDNYAERRRQIDLTAGVIGEVSAGAHLPLVGLTLKVAGLPARRAGWGEIHDYLQRGQRAFAPIRRVQPFIDAIRARELAILDSFFAR